MINQNFSFCTPVFVIRCPLPRFLLAWKTLGPLNRLEILAWFFDNTMSFSPHVNTIAKRAFYHVRNISKKRKYNSKSSTEIVIHSFVSSKLGFCNSLLKQDIVKLQSVQNAAARIIAGLKKRDHITKTWRDLHWLPVEERIVFQINLITFKTLNDSGPRYLEDILKFYHQSRTLRSSRDHLRLEEPNFNMKTYGQRAFSVAAPRLWNKLPFEIVQMLIFLNLSWKRFFLKRYMTFSFIIFVFVFFPF